MFPLDTDPDPQQLVYNHIWVGFNNCQLLNNHIWIGIMKTVKKQIRIRNTVSSQPFWVSFNKC